jgi:hypothetical protein
MKRTTLVIALTAALGAGAASAQLAPGGPPSGPADAGDVRQMPDRRDPAPRATDPSYPAPRAADPAAPGASGTPMDRRMAPYSGDPRYNAPPAGREYDRSARRDAQRGTTWRERWFGPREPMDAYTWERGGRYGPYGNGLGSQQYRFDGPDQGQFIEAPWV